MIIIAYLVVSIIVLLLIGLAQSQKIMNWLSVIHSLSFIIITGYIFYSVVLPQYYFDNNYFFLDHLGVFEILLSAVIFFFACIYAGGYVQNMVQSGELQKKNLKLFYVSLNSLLLIITCSFLSNNLALFWIFAELTTIFSALLIAILYAWDNIDAALKYIFIASAAMLFSFIGLIFLFTLTQNALGTGTVNWSDLITHATALSPTLLAVSFIFTFIGFAAKSGIVPFHTWLPDAHSKAPSAVSAILSAVLLNVGIYGIIRMYSIVKQTSAVHTISLLLIVFGLISIMIAAFHMLQQKNLKKIIAFSSIEHMGLLLISIGIGTPLLLFWSLFHILGHSLTKAQLFFSAGILHKQYESNTSLYMKEVFTLQPVASIGIILGTVSIIGMPPFMVFLSKLFILIGIADYSIWLLFAVLLFMLIASVALIIFVLHMFSKVSKQKQDAPPTKIYKVPQGMKFSIISLIVLTIILGLFFPGVIKETFSVIGQELLW
jgi:hydrogenase-4 component F